MERPFQPFLFGAGVTRWGTSCAMELVLLPSDFCPGAGEGVLHGGAVELTQIFVEFPVREETLSESVCCCLIVAK